MRASWALTVLLASERGGGGVLAFAGDFVHSYAVRGFVIALPHFTTFVKRRVQAAFSMAIHPPCLTLSRWASGKRSSGGLGGTLAALLVTLCVNPLHMRLQLAASIALYGMLPSRLSGDKSKMLKQPRDMPSVRAWLP